MSHRDFPLSSRPQQFSDPTCHKSPASGVLSVVNAQGEAVVEWKAGEAPFDLETVFRANYDRITRVIARIIGDPARAEELAVEVFLKLGRKPEGQGQNSEGWLYRVATRTALDELRRRTRRSRYESLMGFIRGVATPEETHAANQEQQRVRLVLAALPRRQAELLLLRSQDLSYGEVAAALGLNPASVGTLLSRAQQLFRREYVKRYGEQ